MRYWLLRGSLHYTDIRRNLSNTPWDYDKVHVDVRLTVGDVVYLVAAYGEMYGWGRVDKKQSYQDPDLDRRAYRLTVVRPLIDPRLLTAEELTRIPEVAQVLSSSDLNLVQLNMAQANSLNHLLRAKGEIAPPDLDEDETEVVSSQPVKFPQLSLKPGEDIWLNAAYAQWKQGKKIDPRMLFIQLLGKIPEDFEFERIDRRLFSDLELTLLGVLHVDPTSKFAMDTDRVIQHIRNLIIRGQTKATSEEVSEELCIQEERIAIIFGLMRNLGSFWNGLTPHLTFGGYSTITFDAINVVREYLNYKGLEVALERFNRIAAPLSYQTLVDTNMLQTESSFDVCLSFAGEDRKYVERVAAALKNAKVSVFYDGYEEVGLWGKDLYQHLDEIYRTRARYCVIFISAAYAAKLWTKHELKSAQARALQEPREYILPVRFDDTELPAVLATTKYIDLRSKSPEDLAKLITRKIGKDISSDEAEVREVAEEEEAPWKNLTGLASIRKRLSEPITKCEEYQATVERLVENGQWSYRVDIPYPRELRIEEERLDNSITSFRDELRLAADEIDEAYASRQIQPAWFTHLVPNELEPVSKALRTASGAVYPLRNLRLAIRKGLDLQQLRSSEEYKAAVQSLNAIEDAIDVARETERGKVAFFNSLVKRKAT